ncbi:nuclear transport factor 2 family protein [Corallococcus exiguus]|uniref:nuclear transport factor 2 family protein n=1 Tax=Corallococcus exiguus TaxID=83462 RepID=UPI001470F31D|nr:nuclear transport factor 2 family protein [Corallococcus exiguus]NNB87827.1 nuclear transport factor 2 family protein [Corallococcus exiguus]NNC00023.1 nuclear transport factor 2 family protein [Corallococcus exiguus]NNC02106.1 nuclear transport factor 2 family protein [Corallococcus exiguus]
MQTTPNLLPGQPAPIAGYFAHATTRPAAVARCFTDDALVVDERHEHRGRAAIEAWTAAANGKYKFTTELLAAEFDGPRTTVRANVTGNFPGSPIELRYRFTLAGGLITRLEIAP